MVKWNCVGLAPSTGTSSAMLGTDLFVVVNQGADSWQSRWVSTGTPVAAKLVWRFVLEAMLASPLRLSLPFKLSRLFNPTAHWQGSGSCILKN